MFSVRAAIGRLLGLGLITSPTSALAGAWTLEAGTGQALVTSTFSRADKAFDGDGKAQPAPRYDKAELQALLEYGATDRLTLMALPGLQRVSIGAPVDATRTGLGYTEFGGRYRLFGGTAWVFSGQATVRMPGTSNDLNPAAIGHTDPEVDVRALLGYSFSAGNWPAFFDLQVAQRFRTGAPPDEFRADVTLGLSPAANWQLIAQSFNVISEGAGSPPFSSYNYHKLQLSVVYDLSPRLSLQLGGFTAFAGRNALQENGVVFGTWYRF